MPPRILPRPEHTVSRKDIDPDALKVLYRLKNRGFTAYLVGGGVRDLLLGRKPKDFDISTDAHPQQVKKLFRNCFIVGRRFRLAHVHFGKKAIEVATFRRQAEPDQADPLIRRDNTFGTPEEDAFRRDFTVNALFYDIANFSVVDYVGGLEDLNERVIRTIGDPAVRLREDPVRMLRAVAQAARLGFTIDRDTVEAIRFLRGEIVKSSPARLLEEVYKILRQGAARRTFEMLHGHGLLGYLLPEADRAMARNGQHFLGSLARLDDHRNAGLSTTEQLSNPLLLGTLLAPLGLPLVGGSAASRRRPRAGDDEPPEPEPRHDDVARELAELGVKEEPSASGEPSPLALPFARRDLDRLRLVLVAQQRLREVPRSARSQQLLASKAYFDEAVRWLEIHGGVEGLELAVPWRSLDVGDLAPSDRQPSAEETAEPPLAPDTPQRRRRRRRRHRRRPEGPPESTPPAEG